MKKNDTFTITIKDMGIHGEGIGKYDGMTFFVKDAILGDRIVAAVTKLKKDYGYARLVEIIEPSPYRVPARCPKARSCGGCQLQALSYEQQLEWKAGKVRNDLMRIGGLSEERLRSVMSPVVGMEEPFRYRNKAQFPVGYDKEGTVVTGFYAVGSHRIIPVEDCLLEPEENSRILSAIKRYMEEADVSAYDETTGEGLLRHILLRKGFSSRELMVCLVVNGSSLPQEEHLVELLTEIPGMTSILLNRNQKNTNRILGDELRLLWGQEYITDTIHRVQQEENSFVQTGESVTFEISPKSFYQVNPVQTEKLYSLALELAALQGREIVWDLYCGIGTISLFLAQKAGWVYGVELVPEAVEDAKKNALRNHIRNVSFYEGKAEEILPAWVQEENRRPDVIVMDPPRKGCDPKCLEVMMTVRPQRIVYVSCDPATLARDVKALAEGGYALVSLHPVDQFCHSIHIENVALLLYQGAES